MLRLQLERSKTVSRLFQPIQLGEPSLTTKRVQKTDE